MSGITTHVLDTSTGRPARGIPVRLAAADGSGGWADRAHATTNDDGRARLVGPGEPVTAGDYRLTFGVADYLAGQSAGGGFYPRVEVHFRVSDPEEHHHVPLLLSPHGYTTYRGS